MDNMNETAEPSGASGGSSKPLRGRLLSSRSLEGSVGEPAAWGVLRVGGGWVSILSNELQAETSRKSFDKMENWVHEVVPLYRSSTLTDAERNRKAEDYGRVAAELARLRIADTELRAAVRALLDGVNAMYPDKNPREWRCQHMAELDRLVPPSGDEKQ